MRILKQTFRSLLLAAFLLPAANDVQAQVTIGSGEAPSYGALLELKTQQAGAVTNVWDDTNITSTDGGLLLPRVKITHFSKLYPVVKDGDALSVEDKHKLAGLMVYNINVVAGTLYLGIYVWNGTEWAFLTDSKVSSPIAVSEQPKAFSFYETGEETASEVADLTFSVIEPKAADGTTGTVTYQWYRLVGSNLHATIGEKITGATNEVFNPYGTVIRGTTRNAQNAGMYRFYCEATGSDGSFLKSDIVEVAVGCGAKNNLGEWISFMCFNLGAQNGISIDEQKSQPISTYSNDASNGLHTYVSGEETVYGDLFQWGRIADGHEDRQSAIVLRDNMATSDIVSGSRCNTFDTNRPYLQVSKSATTWYGNFITSTSAQDYNWNANASQSNLDQLWRTSRFLSNDPCTHYKVDGSYHEFWHEGTDTENNSAACADAGTAWRTPSQDEWGAIYKGGTISGSADAATANNWEWTGGTGPQNISTIRGYEIKPDGATTTLFLPAGGRRYPSNGSLYNLGVYGYYWSTSIISTNAYNLLFSSSTVTPAYNYYRGIGYALRCIKDS